MEELWDNTRITRQVCWSPSQKLNPRPVIHEAGEFTLQMQSLVQLSSVPERIGGVEVTVHIFLISISDEDTWSAVVSACTREQDSGGLTL